MMFRAGDYHNLRRKLESRNESFRTALDMIRNVVRYTELLTTRQAEDRVVDYWNLPSTNYTILLHQPGFTLICVLKREVRLSRGIKTPSKIRRRAE